MFIHNFKYALKTLYKNKMLLFWTYAFPIILGTFFNMAFSNIENSEKLDIIKIAIIENEDFKNKYLKPLEKFSNSKVVFQDYSMMVKTSMLNDIKMLKAKGAIVNACLVYSMWEGYQEEESFRTFIDNVKLLGIDFKIIHTSGHADIKAIKELAKITQPKKVVTIHTLNKEKSKEIFKNAVSLEDNEEIEV